MKVYDQFNRPKTLPTEAGDHYINEYQEEIKRDGTKDIVYTGKKDVYAIIQIDLESTKIENILHAYAMGDLQALQQKEALYVDATTMPQNLMEAQNIVVKAKSEFEKLPLEVRKEFDYSAEKYVSEMGTKEFLEKLAPYNKKMAEIKEAGSAEEYNKKVAAEAKFQKDVRAAMGGNEE